MKKHYLPNLYLSSKFYTAGSPLKPEQVHAQLRRGDHTYINHALYVLCALQTFVTHIVTNILLHFAQFYTSSDRIWNYEMTSDFLATSPAARSLTVMRTLPDVLL